MKNALVLVTVLALVGTAAAENVWISGRDTVANHQIHLFDLAGNYSLSVDQVPGAQGSAWGYRDGATDGTYVYFGWENGVARHDADGGNGTQIINGGAPGGVATWRALTYDPTLDNGNGGLWVASFGSSLVATNMAGGLLTSFPVSGGWSLYGLDRDPTDGNLWGHTTGGQVIKINTTTGLIMAGGWASGFPNLAAQGGLSGQSILGDRTVALSQGTPDEYGVYNVNSGTLVGGPFDAEGPSGSNGLLGVAVIPEPASLLLLGLAGLVIRRR
jgi:hypothetical protein